MEFRVLVEGERTVGDLPIQIPRVPDSPCVCYGGHKYHSAVCASGCSVQHSGEELQGQQERTEVVDLRDERRGGMRVVGRGDKQLIGSST